MTISKEMLDIPICEITEEASNKETFREFIRNSEKEFGLICRAIDEMDNTQLNEYIDCLDYLWEK